MSTEHAVEVDNLNARVSQLILKVDSLQEEKQGLEEKVETLEQMVEEHDEELDSLSGVAEGKQSTPEKRAMDLRLLMRNSAKAKKEGPGDNPGLVQWTYSKVRDQLEANGHGTIHDPQAYSAMEDAAEGPGFAMTKNDDGTRVVRLSLPALEREAGVNEINNAKADGHPSQTPETEVSTVGR